MSIFAASTFAPDASSGWYAVRTRSNHEATALARLHGKGIGGYLPTVALPSLRADRRHLLVQRPLFPGYLFVPAAVTRSQRLEILRVPGVVEILGLAGAPVVVPEVQVTSIRVALTARNPFEIFYNLMAGTPVRVARGPMAGVEGVLMSGPDGQSRVGVAIEILGRTVAFKLNARDLLPI